MNRAESVVIVGGGIWGLSTAYHLARAGWTDVEVLERNGALFEETTSQAAGLVGQIRATPLMRRAIQYAIDLFLNFEEETDHDPGFHQVGRLLLALTPERMASFEEHVLRRHRMRCSWHRGFRRGRKLDDPGEDLSSVGLERFGEKASDRAWIRREGEAFYGGYYGIPAMSVT